ncbi:hypothetical protein HDU81_007501, partial [Chytriomyces hyalinus]
MSSIPPFDETSILPQEIWLHILKHLDFRSLCRFGLASRKQQIQSLDASLWKSLCLANRVQITEQDPDDPFGTAETVDESATLPQSLLLFSFQEGPWQTNQKRVPDPVPIDYKMKFMLHRRKVLERMKRSRMYWAEYQNLKLAAKAVTLEDPSESLRRMLSVQKNLPAIPCFQCETDKASARPVFGFHRNNSKRDSNATLIPDTEAERSYALPPVTSSLKMSASPYTLLHSSHSETPTTSAMIGESPRSAYIHHTLTSGCALAGGMKNLCSREAVISALVEMDAAEGGSLQFLRQPVVQKPLRMEVSEISLAIQQMRMNAGGSTTLRQAWQTDTAAIFDTHANGLADARQDAVDTRQRARSAMSRLQTQWVLLAHLEAEERLKAMETMAGTDVGPLEGSALAVLTAPGDTPPDTNDLLLKCHVQESELAKLDMRIKELTAQLGRNQRHLRNAQPSTDLSTHSETQTDGSASDSSSTSSPPATQLLQSQLLSLTASLTSASRQTSTLEAKVASLESLLEQEVTRANSGAQELSKAYDAITALTAQLTECNSQLNSERVRATTLEEKNAEVSKVVTDLEANNQELQARNNRLVEANATLLTEKAVLEQSEMKLNDTAKTLELQILELGAQMSAMKRQNDELSLRMSDLESRNARLIQENSDLNSHSAELGDCNGALDARIKEIEFEKSHLESRIHDSETRNRDLESHCNQLEALFESTAIEMKALEELHSVQILESRVTLLKAVGLDSENEELLDQDASEIISLVQTEMAAAETKVQLLEAQVTLSEAVVADLRQQLSQVQAEQFKLRNDILGGLGAVSTPAGQNRSVSLGNIPPGNIHQGDEKELHAIVLEAFQRESSRVAVLESNCDALEKRQQATTKELSETQQNVELLETKLKDAEMTASERRVALDQLSKEYDVLQTQNAALHMEMETLGISNQQMENHLSSITAQHSLQTQLLTETMDHHLSDYTEALSQIEHLKSQISQHEIELECSRNQCHNELTKSESLASELQSLRKERDLISTQLADSMQELTFRTAALDESNVTIARLREELDESISALVAMEPQHQQQLTEYREQIDRLQITLSGRETDLAMQTEAVWKLQEKLYTLEHENQVQADVDKRALETAQLELKAVSAENEARRVDIERICKEHEAAITSIKAELARCHTVKGIPSSAESVLASMTSPSSPSSSFRALNHTHTSLTTSGTLAFNTARHETDLDTLKRAHFDKEMSFLSQLVATQQQNIE